jgi:hypothetical protein
MSVGKFLSSGTDEVDVRAFLKNQACSLNGVSQALNAGYSPGFHSPSVHEQSVELNAAIRSQETSLPCVERGVVFQNSDCGFDCIDGGAAAR